MIMQIGTAAYADDPQMPALCSRGLKVGVAVQGAKYVAAESDMVSPQPETGYPPYLIPLSSNGMEIEAQGLDISIIRLITRKINCPKSSSGVQTYYADFDTLYDRLRNGQFDFIVAALSLDIPIKERHGLSFSMPYNDKSGIALAARPDLADKFNRPPGHKQLKDRLASNGIKHIYTVRDSFKDGTKFASITGIIDAGITEIPKGTVKEVLAEAVAESSNSVVMLDYQALNYLIGPSTTSVINGWGLLIINPAADGDDRYLVLKTGDAVAVRSDDLELLKFINRTINEARLDGTLRGIQNAWLPPVSTATAAAVKTSTSAAAQFMRARTLHNAGKAPAPNKWNLGLEGSGDYQFTRKKNLGIGVTFKPSLDVPRERQRDWPCISLKRLIVNPFCVPLFDQVGINLKFAASDVSVSDAEIAITQEVSPGIFWRANWPRKREDQPKLWFELDVNATWKKSTSANKPAPELKSSNTLEAIFVPKIGASIPIIPAKLSLLPSVSIDKAFRSSEHPTPTVVMGFGIEIKLD